MHDNLIVIVYVGSNGWRVLTPHEQRNLNDTPETAEHQERLAGQNAR